MKQEGVGGVVDVSCGREVNGEEGESEVGMIVEEAQQGLEGEGGEIWSERRRGRRGCWEEFLEFHGVWARGFGWDVVARSPSRIFVPLLVDMSSKAVES